MIVINQDRNGSIKFNTHADELRTKPVISDSILIGINLYLGETLLGTFISVVEAIKEINNIYSCTNEEYYVTIY